MDEKRLRAPTARMRSGENHLAHAATLRSRALECRELSKLAANEAATAAYLLLADNYEQLAQEKQDLATLYQELTVRVVARQERTRNIGVRSSARRLPMAAAKKQSSRGRKQDRARVAGGQRYEVDYEATKTGRSKAAVKSAVKKRGNSRRKVEQSLSR